MKVAVYGNNRGAVRILEFLTGFLPASDLFAVAPYSEKVYFWADSVLDFARNHGIRVIQDPGDASLKREILQDMRRFAPDVLLSVFYGLYIDPEIIAVPSRYAINFHASLLPKYRGFAPLIWAIANGESETGVSAQFMNTPYNQGDILMQRPLPIGPDDTGYTLHNAATDLIARMLPDLWEMIERDAFDPRPQDSFGSYYPRDSQRINQINWRYSAASIRNVVRALAPPMPGAYSYLDGTRCILARVGLRRRGVPNMAPGEICFLDDEVLVATGQDYLALESVVVDGAEMDGPTFHKRHLEHLKRPALRNLPEDSGFAPETIAMEGGQPVCQKYIFFGLPSLGDEEERAMVETLRSQWIGMGKKTLEFENRFAEYVGSGWALSTSSCTAALHLGLLALGIGPGDEVVTTPLTFVATANAIEYTGARPVFADVEPGTLNLDPERVAAAITPRTKAILPVHFGGLPVNMEAFEALAHKHGLSLLYDAAHAVGGAYKGVRIGGGGHLSCFSFYPNKNLTTCEGGMVTGNDESVLGALKLLRQHGLRDNAWQRYQTKRVILYEASTLGYKYNMTDLQSAIGLAQLEKLEGFQKRREEIALYYNSMIQDMDCVASCYQPHLYDGSRHALHLYIILLDMDKLCTDRNQIAAALREENIGVGIHYLPVHRHAYYREKYALSAADYPVADRAGNTCITLPTNPSMSRVDAAMVIKALRKVLTWYSR